MHSNIITFVAPAVLALLLLGCKKASDPPKPVSSNGASASESIATSPSALPPSDAAIKPASSGPSNSGDANGPTQATPTELSKAQESTAMPMSGQVNNHSTPATTGEKK